MSFNLPNLAHSRIETLDAAGLPLVVMVGPDGEPFKAWLRYVKGHHLGIGSQRSHSRSLGLFMDFIMSRGSEFLPKTERHRLFHEFADALIWGTIREGKDPSGLWWLPHTSGYARKTINQVTAFSDWLADSGLAAPVNPTRIATLAEQLLFWRSWQRSSSASLLGHLKSANRARMQSLTARVVGVRQSTPKSTLETKTFPDSAFIDLLKTGFRRSMPLYWTTLRDQMILLLLHGGGLRVSEPLHLWVPSLHRHSRHPGR
jgi:hypothetical protein